MPELVGDGLLVAGDAAALCLAAGIWLEGRQLRASARARPPARPPSTRCAAATRQRGRTGRLPAAPRRELRARRPQEAAPRARTSCCPTGCSTRTRTSSCDVVEPLFTVDNPRPSRGLLATAWRRAAASRTCACATLAKRRVGRAEDVRMSAANARTCRRSRFEDRMATVDFRVAPDAHITVDGDACRGCTTRECVAACPANLFVPTVGRRHPLQLRAVLRVRHLLPGLQHRGRHHLELPRGRPRRRLPALVSASAGVIAAASSGSTGGPRSTR